VRALDRHVTVLDPARHRGLPRRGPPHSSGCTTTGGSVYYNDSKGTNVDSTIKALESFSEAVILIAGGKGQGPGLRPHSREAARGRVRRAILIGQDRARIRAALELQGIPAEDAESMD